MAIHILLNLKNGNVHVNNYLFELTLPIILLVLSYNEPFTMPELKHALSQVSETAPGNDEITYSTIKHIHCTLTYIILQTFNRIYNENIFLNTWTTAKPIARHRKDHTNPLNYRPIALTSCLCKLLENMIDLRLIWYLEGNNVITNVQSRFRKK